MRLEGKIAVIIGTGQSPGEGIGNGRATTIRFAREGARIVAVDRSISSAEETAAMAVKEGGECVPFEADVTREETLGKAIEAAQARWGASTSCTTMSGSASVAATSRSTSSPKRCSIESVRSICAAR